MLKNYFDLFRIPQWIKNLFVFVPLLFSLHLFEAEYFLTTLKAFISFCFASSLIYVINDIIDIEADALHPKKKYRPLPSGNVSKKSALTSALILLFIIIVLLMFTNTHFILITLGLLY